MNDIALQTKTMNESLSENSVLKTVKILFGHRSVGSNIMDGIIRLNEEIPKLSLVITDQKNLLQKDSVVFYHYKNGENTFPYSKVDSFYSNITKFNQRVNIAFFKFCYADITRKTDVEKLFAYYKEKMSLIESSSPNIRFIHFTVPLKTKPKGFKGAIKSLIKWDDNRKRNEFNNMIRKEYPENKIFDLARYESTYMDNSIENSINGVPALRSDLTSDGGHLNALGEDYIGALLLLKINSIARE